MCKHLAGLPFRRIKWTELVIYEIVIRLLCYRERKIYKSIYQF